MMLRGAGNGDNGGGDLLGIFFGVALIHIFLNFVVKVFRLRFDGTVSGAKNQFHAVLLGGGDHGLHLLGTAGIHHPVAPCGINGGLLEGVSIGDGMIGIGKEHVPGILVKGIGFIARHKIRLVGGVGAFSIGGGRRGLLGHGIGGSRGGRLPCRGGVGGRRGGNRL